MSPLLSVVKAKLQSLSVSMQLVLPDGVRVGPDDAAVRLTAPNKVALTRSLAASQTWRVTDLDTIGAARALRAARATRA